MNWCTIVAPQVRTALSLGVLALSLGACSKERLVQGECRPVNGADVCAWDRMSGNTLVAFGATIPMHVIDSAPAEAPMTWPPVATATIPLSRVAQAASGFDNITIFWEPHGHPPAPYLQPHFDFHFNTISAAELAAIDCVDSAKPAQLPATYEMPDVDIPGLGTLIGLCVPTMGMHSMPGAELSAPTPFEKTMVVGYYRGQPIFIEPMITRTTLLARRTFPLTVPVVPNGPQHVRYPTRFVAEYDSTAQQYRFVFSGLGAGATQQVSSALSGTAVP
jgi:hypothetical protein